MEEYCICKHPKEKHKTSAAYFKIYCVACAAEAPAMREYWAAMHDFKLDNLRWIEDLATQKGLI
jgi:hypothetical protein